MAFIRSIEKIGEKFATVTPTRASEYDFGVRNPRKSWAGATAASESSYEAGVQGAIAKKKFGKGVKAAGDTAWAEGAVQKGTQRWGPGVALARDKYQRGFAPYHAAIERTQLPPRYPRRDPRNLARVEAIDKALSAVKEGMAK